MTIMKVHMYWLPPHWWESKYMSANQSLKIIPNIISRLFNNTQHRNSEPGANGIVQYTHTVPEEFNPGSADTNYRWYLFKEKYRFIYLTYVHVFIWWHDKIREIITQFINSSSIKYDIIIFKIAYTSQTPSLIIIAL